MLTVLDKTPAELALAVAERGWPPYRTDQIIDWVYRKGVGDPAGMPNLPREITGELHVLTARLAARADSADGTVKLLLEFPDAQAVECVLIPTGERHTACLSTQAGCGMGCRFCASGLDGLQRNLTSGEILEQMLALRQAVPGRISNVVFMGSGEPLANYEATLGAIRAIVDPERFGLSARSVTVSTVGLPAAIRRLAREGLAVTLAISLHAPNDALRRILLPAADNTTIAEILTAAKDFFHARKREVTLEYVLLADVNDSALCADGLAGLAGRLRCNVNLIGYNEVPGMEYRAPTPAGVKAFAQRLTDRGVNVHVRHSRGADTHAACGQLRGAVRL
jgi:23S rRNA (adenine2503-C2)-methyltransferase